MPPTYRARDTSRQNFVFGGPELLAALDALSERAASRELEIAARAGAIIVQRKWKSLFRKKSEESIAGQPPRRQTGQYAQSIHVEVIESDRTHVVVAVGTSITDPPYPMFLEYGTSKMPPHPIARPAYDLSKRDALAEVEAVLRSRLGL